MNFPPPSYDDGSVVPEQRLKNLLGAFEGEMGKIQSVFRQHLPGQFHVSRDVDEEHFWSLRATAEKLGSEYSFLIEKLISDYDQFKREPDQEKLDQIFNDVKSLQLLLVG